MTFTESLILALFTAILTGLVTALVSYFGFWRQIEAEIKKDYQTKFTEKKWEVYLKVVNLNSLAFKYVHSYAQKALFEDIKNKYKGIQLSETYIEFENIIKLSEEQFKDALGQIDLTTQDVENELFLIGSSNVIESFYKWRVALSKFTVHKTFTQDTLELYNQLLNNMSSDLGGKDTEITLKMMYGETEKENYSPTL